MSEDLKSSSCDLGDEDVAAIRKVDAAYVSTVPAKEWERLTMLLTPEAVVMPPNERAVRGRAANLARFQSFNFASADYRHSLTYIGGNGPVAYLQGDYSLRMTLAGAAEPYADTGEYLWVLRKQDDGRWLADRIMWNTNLAKSAGYQANGADAASVRTKLR